MQATDLPICAITSTQFEPLDPDLREFIPIPRGPTIVPLLDVNMTHHGVGRRNCVVPLRSMPRRTVRAT